MKLLNGQRKLILGSTYELINMTGGAGELKEENNRKEGPLLRKDKHQDTRNNTRTQTGHRPGGAQVQVLHLGHIATLFWEQLSLVGAEICYLTSWAEIIHSLALLS